MDAELEAKGLGEYKATLLSAGLTTWSDFRGVTDTDLEKLGIDKLFHRKRLLQLAEQQQQGKHLQAGPQGGGQRSAPPSPVAPSVTPPPQLDHCGDHVRVEVIGARGGEIALTERDYYVKVSVCDKIDHEIYPIDTTTQRTGKARGPVPTWTGSDKAVMKVKTSFRSHCLAFELKECRLLGENKHIGVLIFPMSKFHTFTNDTVEDTWIPMRVDSEASSEVTAMLRLRLSVPGGCPRQNGPAFHVTAVLMTARKLKITIFEALIENGRDEPSSPGGPADDGAPNTYVTVHLDEVVSKPGETSSSATLIKAKTRVAKRSWNPVFDEGFEFFAEAGKCKLLTVKLKEESGAVFTTHDLVGQVKIPVQYYMAQKKPAEVDELFPAYDEAGNLRARLHVRLQVLAAESGDSTQEAGASFRRTESMRKANPIDVDTHPAFSPRRSRSNSVASEPEALRSKFVSDTETDDDDKAMAKAAARNQQHAKVAASSGGGALGNTRPSRTSSRSSALDDI